MSSGIANHSTSAAARLCITCAFYGGARLVKGFGSYVEWPHGADQGICNHPRRFGTATIPTTLCQYHEYLPGLR